MSPKKKKIVKSEEEMKEAENIANNFINNIFEIFKSPQENTDNNDSRKSGGKTPNTHISTRYNKSNTCSELPNLSIENLEKLQKFRHLLSKNKILQEKLYDIKFIVKN